MFSRRATQVAIRSLDGLAGRLLPADESPGLLQHTARNTLAFRCAKLGYVIGARNYRSAQDEGAIDRIAWYHDVLGFIEVKTRKTREAKSAVAASTAHKRGEIATGGAQVSAGRRHHRGSGGSMW